MEHAVVYDPMRQELFTASRGQGAQVDGHRIRVSGQRQLERALVGTGFPYRRVDPELGPYLEMLAKVLKSTSGVRRPGSAALDLAYVAAGRLDAFWETGLKSWDLAAGSLIIREAGWQRELPRHRPHTDWHTEDLPRHRQALRIRDQSTRLVHGL